MSPLIVGKYKHEKNENLEEYFQAIGVSYIPRKMMVMSNPELDISVNEMGEWTITRSSFTRTAVLKFKLGEEYESMPPGGVLIKSRTEMEENKLKTTSIGPDNGKVIRIYEFKETHCILTMIHESGGKKSNEIL